MGGLLQLTLVSPPSYGGSTRPITAHPIPPTRRCQTHATCHCKSVGHIRTVLVCCAGAAVQHSHHPFVTGSHWLGYIWLWVLETSWVAQANEVAGNIHNHNVFKTSFNTAPCPGFMSQAAISSGAFCRWASTVSYPSRFRALMYGCSTGF